MAQSLHREDGPITGPNSAIGPTFGLINNAQGERNLQFALKYMF